MGTIGTGFGKKMKQRRRQLKKTHEALAAEIHVSRKSVEHWEKGTVSSESIKAVNIANLCEALQCDFAYLFGNQPFPTKEETDIIAVTGLDAEAVKLLHTAKKDNHWFVCQAVNQLLKFDNLRLLDLLGQYLMMDESETVELNDGERIDKGVLYSRKIEQELVKLRFQIQRENRCAKSTNNEKDNPDAYIWTRGAK